MVWRTCEHCGMSTGRYRMACEHCNYKTLGNISTVRAIEQHPDVHSRGPLLTTYYQIMGLPQANIGLDSAGHSW